MVKVFCDRCGNEVENLDALLQFAIEVSEQANRSAWNWRAEVCQECYESMKEEITNRIIALPSTEEKKKGPKR